ncbi:MAG: DUF1761 domain-containing protein [Balneolaceae bacterium]|jgi:hypothetical protein|nr:MAG: DUF1761 domain-containing protein [Balneolaceae bacterium]
MDSLFSLDDVLIITGAAIVYFVAGAFWYSPMLFAKPWMKRRNLTKEDLKPNPVLYLKTFGLQFAACCSLYVFIMLFGITTGLSGLILGAACGAGFILTTSGITGLFADKPPVLFWIDSGYHVAGLGLAGFTLGLGLS